MTLAMSLPEVAARADAIVRAVEQVVIGKREVVELVLTGLMADGHVLLEDVPGVAKTLLARSFAQVTGLEFTRVQFTPDLMPADVTGSSIFDQRTNELVFRPGPVFTHVLLGDEINRASPKTQAALLEAMAERQVTVDGESRKLERPFLVIATQNPVEYEGTYPLPEAQLDRFLLRLSVGYPDADAEWEVLARRMARREEMVTLAPVVTAEELVAMQVALEEVHVSASVGRYMVRLASATRTHPGVEIGASPRGSLALLVVSRARAVLSGRDYVVPEDVKAIAVAALAHRLRLKAELWMRGDRPDDVVRACLQQVPTPPTLEPGEAVDAEETGVAEPA